MAASLATLASLGFVELHTGDTAAARGAIVTTATLTAEQREAAITTAQLALATARTQREAECQRRGPLCRDREADERTALATLNAAIAAPVPAAATIAAPDPQVTAVVRLTTWAGFRLAADDVVNLRLVLMVVDRGENPATEKAVRAQANRLLFSAVMDDYLAAKARTLKPRSLEESTRHLKKHWRPLHGLPIGSLTRSIVAGHLTTIAKDSGTVAADRARSTLSAMYAWAIGEGHDVTNPVIGTNRHSDDTPRDRILSDAELVTIWRSAPENAYGRIVRLLMLTAQRRDEIGGLLDSEIDTAGKAIVLPKGRTKNNRAHLVPLSDMAMEVIEAQPRRATRDIMFGEGEGGYSGWSRSKEALDDVAKLKQPWTLHDLRRTAATRMADLGVQPHVIEAVLNHVSGHKAGVAGIYNLSTYAVEKRAALDLWAAHVRALIAQAEGANVHRLKARK